MFRGSRTSKSEAKRGPKAAPSGDKHMDGLVLKAGLWRRRRWAFGLAAFGTALLVLQSLPLVAGALMASLEERAGPVLQNTDGAQAIVVRARPDWISSATMRTPCRVQISRTAVR